MTARGEHAPPPTAAKTAAPAKIPASVSDDEKTIGECPASFPRAPARRIQPVRHIGEIPEGARCSPRPAKPPIAKTRRQSTAERGKRLRRSPGVRFREEKFKKRGIGLGRAYLAVWRRDWREVMAERAFRQRPEKREEENQRLGFRELIPELILEPPRERDRPLRPQTTTEQQQEAAKREEKLQRGPESREIEGDELGFYLGVQRGTQEERWKRQRPPEYEEGRRRCDFPKIAILGFWQTPIDGDSGRVGRRCCYLRIQDGRAMKTPMVGGGEGGRREADWRGEPTVLGFRWAKKKRERRKRERRKKKKKREKENISVFILKSWHGFRGANFIKFKSADWALTRQMANWDADLAKTLTWRAADVALTWQEREESEFHGNKLFDGGGKIYKFQGGVYEGRKWR